MLPPETEYHHVLPGVVMLGALGLVLLSVVAWRLGRLSATAPALVSMVAVVIVAASVLWFRRCYRHAVAGVLTVALLLALLVAVVHRNGYVGAVIEAAGPTASAFAGAR